MSEPGGLRELAWGAGVATGYHDIGGVWHETATEVLQALLEVLGLPAGSDAAVADAHAALHRRAWLGLVEPTAVCWADQPAELVVHRRVRDGDAPVEVRVELEGGGGSEWVVTPDELEEVARADVDGVDHVAHRVVLGGAPLPFGAHRIEIAAAARTGTAVVLVAPRLAPALAHGWGVFAPAYGLRAGEAAGVRPGGVAELGRLADWVAGLGGNVVATLPLLATFEGEPSPYVPVSRLAWSARFLDLAACSEGDGDEAALIDWQLEDERIRRRLDERAAGLSDRERAAVDAFCAAHPHVDALAGWFAEVERSGPPVPGAALPAAAPDAALRHRVAQWAMDGELRALSERLGARGQSLLLDLPLGVHREGFDVWRHPELFGTALDVGAPPDDFNPDGQSWGFPPIVPQNSRTDGHRYLRAGLAHQLRHAGAVRIDHVMALHRLWWIPQGASAADGAYVRYPAEELAAVVTLEAWRAGAAVVGENLGTVPPEVDALLVEHGFGGMYATQFELDAAPHARTAPAGSVAVVNTHDMAPFAAYWADLDDEHRERILEQLGAAGCAPVGVGPLEVLGALLGWLGQSDAATVIVTLEDLWGEALPQNVPGTGADQPNWRRRMARSLDDIGEADDLAHRLDRLRSARLQRVGVEP